MRNVIASGAFCALSVCALFSPANADPNWSGFSVSLGGGAGKTNSNLSSATSNTDTLDIFSGFVDFVGTANGSSSVSDNTWHGFGTVQAGYDQRFGNFVVGGFADFDFYPDRSSTSGTSSVDGNIEGFFLGNSFGSIPVSNFSTVSSTISLENTWGVGGRLGYLVTPSILIYGVGGYTQAKMSGQIDLVNNVATFVGLGTDTITLSAPKQLSGYFVGAGGEAKVADNLALRLEYRYASYSGQASTSQNFSDGCCFGIIDYSQNAQIKAHLDEQIHTIRAALVWQLGNP